MNKLIIDVAGDKIFLMIIANDNIYNITHENTKINYEKLTLIIKEFLELNKFLCLNLFFKFLPAPEKPDLESIEILFLLI